MAKEIAFKIKLDGGDKVVKTLNEMEEEIKAINDELKKETIGSDRFNQLAAAAKKAQGDLQNFSDSNLKSVSSLEKLEGGSKIFAGAISAASGALAAFGVENENAAKTIAKLQGALAIAQGVKDAGEGLAKLGINATKVGGAFTKLGGIIKGNPLILLVTIIAGVIAASGKLNDIIEFVGKAFSDVFEKIQPVLDVLQNVIDAALQPLLKVLMPIVDILGKALVPILNVALIPLKLFGTIMEALTPLITLVGDAITALLEPITAIADGIGGLITDFANWIGLNEELPAAQKKTKVSTEDLQKAVKSLEESNNQLNEAEQFQIDLLKAQGADLETIRQKEVELAKAKYERAAAEGAATAALIESQLVTEKDPKKRQELLDQLKEANNKTLQAQREFQLKSAQADTDRKKEEDDRNKKANEAAQKRREENKKNAEEASKKFNEQQKKLTEEGLKDIEDAANQEILLLKQKFLEQGQLGADATQELADKEQDIRDQQLEATLAFLQKRSEEIKNATFKDKDEQVKQLEELNKAIIKTQSDLVASQTKQAQDDIVKRNEAIIQSIEQGNTELSNKLTSDQIKLTQETTSKLQDLNEKLRRGDIESLEEFERQKTLIIRDAENKRRDLELQNAQDRLTNLQTNKQKELTAAEGDAEKIKEINTRYGAEQLAAEQEIADKTLEIQDNTTQQYIDDLTERQNAAIKATEEQVAALNEFAAALSGSLLPASENFGNTFADSLLRGFANISSGIGPLLEDLKKPVDSFATLEEKSLAVADKVGAAFAFIGGAINEIGNLINAENQRQLEELQSNNQQVLDDLAAGYETTQDQIDEQVEKGIITKEEGDKRKAQAEQNYNKQLQKIQAEQLKKETDLKRQAFNQEKKARIAAAIAQGAAAAIAAYTAGAAVPLVGPVTAGPAFAALSALFTAAQVAIIAKQQFAEPTGTAGGNVPTPSGS